MKRSSSHAGDEKSVQMVTDGYKILSGCTIDSVTPVAFLLSLKPDKKTLTRAELICKSNNFKPHL